jgi:hypothetical protein
MFSSIHLVSFRLSCDYTNYSLWYSNRTILTEHIKMDDVNNISNIKSRYECGILRDASIFGIGVGASLGKLHNQARPQRRIDSRSKNLNIWRGVQL